MSSLQNLNVSYDFYQLGATSQNGSKYPAVSVANFSTLLGAKISAGEAYKYGESVQSGRTELKTYIANLSASCENTHFILAGYSQGAQVVSTTLSSLPANKITYVATFGDPKLYLPEGIALEDNTIPACNGIYSDYRVNVPDCRVVEGVLEANVPYRPDTLKNKVGTWCNYADFMCGSKFDFNNLMYGHTSYQSNGSFAEISKQITAAVSAEQSTRQASAPLPASSQTDVAILIDDTNITYSNRNIYDQLIYDTRNDYPSNTKFFYYHFGKIYNKSTAYAIQEAIEHTDWQNDSKKEIAIISNAPYQLDSVDNLIKLRNIHIKTVNIPDTSDIKFSSQSLTPLSQLPIILSSDNHLSLIIVNDAILGFTDQTNLTITDLQENDKVTIIPIDNNGRKMSAQTYYYHDKELNNSPLVVKAPNSGEK